ncbi:MAG TPA: shikimate kinase [Isosphaeraceae bacterium]|jgi:shikimate kinase|nr:shikimate kinase [Isosphaeraceae bacterium]
MSQEERRGAGLTLVGPRGTGKSTAGQIVAQRLGLPFFDTDTLIEATWNRSIRDIFAEGGEPRFRDLEQLVLDDYARRPPAVIATGGGIVLREPNRQTLRRYGKVVWLTGDPRVLADRLMADPRTLLDRPALTPAGTIAELADVMAARAPLYEAVADITIDSTGKTIAEVAEAVLRAIQEAGALVEPPGAES